MLLIVISHLVHKKIYQPDTDTERYCELDDITQILFQETILLFGCMHLHAQ